MPKRTRAAENAKAEKLLVAVYDRYRAELGDYPWELETDRWGELVACVLSEAAGLSWAQARAAVETLSTLGVIGAADLASSDEEQQRLVQDVIRRLSPRSEASSESCSQTARLLVRIARTVTKRWNGHIQRFLRQHGSKMVSDLASLLEGNDLPRSAAAKIATLWLQNVANLPLLKQDDEHIRRFRASAGLSNSELLHLADEFHLNVAVLDDILALHSRAATVGGSATRSKSATARGKLRINTSRRRTA